MLSVRSRSDASLMLSSDAHVYLALLLSGLAFLYFIAKLYHEELASREFFRSLVDGVEVN